MNYEHKVAPFDHQDELFERTWDLPFWGLLWEQGCGKSKPVIDTAARLYEAGKIDAVLVVAPGGVERNWFTDEMPTHLPDRVATHTHSMVFRSSKSATKYHQRDFDGLVRYQGFAWMFISYDAFMSKRGKAAVWRFLRRRTCLYVLDESDDIKTPNAKRTKSVLASGRYAPFRRILTGTPADKPFDLYTQLRFLDRGIWKRRGMENYFAFKQYFGEWLMRAESVEELGYDLGYDKLLRYRNLDELAKILASMSDRLLKTDVLDLPPKLYTKIYFDMTPKQASLYAQLRDELEIELDSGAVVDGNMALTRLLRLQQITCGYMVTDADEPVVLCDTKNPRLDATIAFLERLNHPAIIWARFRHDVDQIVDALGERACRYDGALSDDDCERSKLAFNGGEKQFFVGNPAKGARGITINVAKTTVYHSNSFKFRDRIQSEDRNHRPGQSGTDHGEYGFGVLLADVVAPGTIDQKIVENLRAKFDIAAQLTGDELREWI